MSTGNEILDRIRALPGLVIPTCWFHVPDLRNDRDEDDFLPMIVLAELLCLHEDVWDDSIGGLRRGWEKLLVATPSQRSPADLARKSGCSEQNARDACELLRMRGLITLEFRKPEEVSSSGDSVLNNAPFIAPVADRLGDMFMRGSQEPAKIMVKYSAEDETTIE